MAQIFGRNRRRAVAAGLVAALLVVAVAGGLVLTGSLGSGSASSSPGVSGSGAIAGASASNGAGDSGSGSAASADASASASSSDTASPGDTTAGETGSGATESASATAAATGAAATAHATPTAAPTPTLGPTPTPAKPELAFVSVDAPTQRCGQPGHVSVRIANRGTAATGGEVQVNVLDTYSGIRTSASNYFLPAMEPGAERSFSHGLVNELGCDLNHVFSVSIDPEDAIDESNEFNNTTTRTYHVDPMPDLSSTWLATNVDPTCSHEFVATAIVNNQGGLATPRGGLAKFTDSYGGVAQKSVYVNFPVLGSGANTTIHAHITVTTHCGQPHTLTILVDSARAITESHEDNNTRSIDYRM